MGLRETLTFTRLLKDMIKDRGEQTNGEIHGVRSGSVGITCKCVFSDPCFFVTLYMSRKNCESSVDIESVVTNRF